MLEDLPPVLMRMLRLWNGDRLDPAHVYATGCKLNGGPSTFDPAEVAREIAALHAAFPDLGFALDASFRAGDRHVLRMTATGTHTGEPFTTEIGTAAPSGAPVQLQGIEVFEVRGDRIVDVWLGWNFAPLYGALGGRFEAGRRGHGATA